MTFKEKLELINKIYFEKDIDEKWIVNPFLYNFYKDTFQF